jgi:type II secretory pathway component GspD/PulD (secretin)
MSWRLSLVVLLLAAVAWAGDPPAPVCAAGEFAAEKGCTPSVDDRQDAAHAFKQGLRLQGEGKLDRALDAFAYAQKLVPSQPDYLSSEAIVRQQLVMRHLERGNYFLAEKRQVEAVAEFRTAVEFDPGNEFAQQRLRDAVGDDAPPVSASLRLVSESSETQMAPQGGVRSFHYRGDTRSLIEEIARQFGIEVVFDPSFTSRPVRFDIDGADFYAAMVAAGRLSKSFWEPLATNQMMVAADTQENRRQFERMSVRTYYVSDATSVEELNQVSGIFRALFDVRFIAVKPDQNLIQVRGPRRVLDAADQLIAQIAARRPQLMLDIRAYELDQNLLRQLGVELPLQFRIFNVGSALRTLQNNPDIQSLINQLIASGGINQANSGDIAALLAALTSQQNSFFSQPFATFGGGLTLTAIQPLNPLTAHFQVNESRTKTLEHMMLRAADGKAATFMLGERFPIINASFSPVFNTPAIAQVIQNQSFQAPFPSFTYVDLGLSLKAIPAVHASRDVSLALELSIKSLTGVSVNNVPVLSNREYTGSVRLKEGESALVLGYMTQSEQRSFTGMPGLSYIPLLNYLVANQTKNVQDTEIMVMITPYILSPGRSGSGPEVWIPASWSKTQ